jgi:hypothetical protein
MSSSNMMEGPSLSGKIIPAQFVRIHDSHKGKPVSSQPAPGAAGRVAGLPKEPKITLLKEGDTVKTIEIECTCGAVIRLDCEY